MSSFANTIISSVNNKEKSTNTLPKSIPSSSSDGDIGYKKDINTEMKESVKINPPSKNTVGENLTENKKSSKGEIIQNGLFNGFTLGIIGNISIILASIIIILLILNHYNIKVFGNLGDTIDIFINSIYNILFAIYNLFKPVIDNIQYILFGTLNQASRSAAIGVKSTANETSEMTDELTDPIINDKKNNKKDKKNKKKINEKLKDDINKPTNNNNKVVKNDNVDSVIQNKSNWCYIGEDQGVRKCVTIGDSKCMSGMVYSSYDNCINN